MKALKPLALVALVCPLLAACAALMNTDQLPPRVGPDGKVIQGGYPQFPGGGESGGGGGRN